MTAQQRLQEIQERAGRYDIVDVSIMDLLDIARELAEENKRLAKALLLIETHDPHDFDKEDWKYYDATVMIAREALKEDQ